MNRNPTRLMVHLMLVILTGLLLTCGVGACDSDGGIAPAIRPPVAEAATTMPHPLNTTTGVDKWALWRRPIPSAPAMQRWPKRSSAMASASP